MPSIQECSDYSVYSKLFHSPSSVGLLGLPFQRSVEACRKFTSRIIESVIRNITSKITDLDLAHYVRYDLPPTLLYIITGDINAMWIRQPNPTLYQLHQARRLHHLATESSRLSKEIRDAIYKYGLTDHPTYGKIFAYEVDGYGSSLIMDDANIPSLLSLSFIGFINQNDTLLSKHSKTRLVKRQSLLFLWTGRGGPHVHEINIYHFILKNTCITLGWV